jgi:hypothetical protein
METSVKAFVAESTAAPSGGNAWKTWVRRRLRDRVDWARGLQS